MLEIYSSGHGSIHTWPDPGECESVSRAPAMEPLTSSG